LAASFSAFFLSSSSGTTLSPLSIPPSSPSGLCSCGWWSNSN